jgi:lipid A 3-O-deacylase
MFFRFAPLTGPGELGGHPAQRWGTLKPMNTNRLFLLASIAALPISVMAADLRPAGYFVQGGLAERQTYSLTAGLLWPWSWRRDFGRTELTGLTEGFVSYWNARGVDGRQSFTQIGVLPVLRMRFDGGRSDWFIEGGIGVSLMDRTYRTSVKEFSTTGNFVDVVGVGRTFGGDRRRELSLRFAHISNANIKKPNPGEEFLQLRYAVMF